MTVLAHPSHWLAQAIYLAPLVALVIILVWTQIRDRRERAADVVRSPDRGDVRGEAGDTAGDDGLNAGHDR